MTNPLPSPSALGIYPTIANTISWCANNVEGVYKRGVTLGIVIGWGNINGVMSSNVYPTYTAPQYTLGHSVLLAYFIVFLFGGSVLTHFMLEWENRQKRAGKRNYLVEGKSEEEVYVLGDRV